MATARTMNKRTPMSASTLIGDSIKNLSGDELGTVEEIMIDCSSGKVAYVVMASGGFLGLGEKYFALPMSALALDTEAKCFRMEADKETFENAEGFDKSHWPNMSDPSWEQNVHETFRSRPYWESPATRM